MQNIEEQLKTIVIASEELIEGASNLTLRRNYVRFNNAQGYYQAYMESIKQQIQLMKGYATSYKGFERLNPQDRAKVFMETRFNLICGEGFIYRDVCYIACSSSDNFLKALDYYPWLQSSVQLVERSRQLWRFIQNLNFTKYETSFYLAFLFFSVFERPNVLSSLTAEVITYLSEAISDLKKSYQSYMAKQYPNNGLYEQRSELMKLAVRLTTEESEYRVKTGKKMVVPKFNGDDIGTRYYNVINSKVPHE